MMLDVGHTLFRFYRHYELYNSIRVEKFLSEYWHGVNSEVKKPYRELTGWQNQAMRFYTMCYNAAKSQAEKAKK